MNRKKLFICLLIIAFLLFMALCIILFSKQDTEVKTYSQSEIKELLKEYEKNKKTGALTGTENVTINEQGIVENKSSNLKKGKLLGNLIIENIKVMYQNNQTVITVSLKNNTFENIKIFSMNVLIKNNVGTTYKEVTVPVGDIPAVSVKPLEIKIRDDVTNMKDIEFK